MSKNTQSIVAWQEEALRDYVNERMSPKQFAEHIGAQVDTVYEILAGKTWVRAKRPEGFQYPWTGTRRKTPRILSQSEIDQALALREAEGWSHRELAQNVGVHFVTVYRWMKATEHAASPTPDGGR